ncbi:glycosyltransferase [Effusibacillus lacus]|uniref:Glycosyltransferase 2-like domain-containing protein n=1 Tax=Effusibacillus lacus TaxID=1348429 RepID=A0A292YKG1_9BACL|nr:glycosyltransferase [Effusibacillus lacus]TCS69782.1 glycosyl transferase family 2 [Effusibacillus lacus]GAX88864.1 hypothetical protein EFBL_0478 [Effusibacillus lacus]
MLALLIWAFAVYGLIVGVTKLVRFFYRRSSPENRLTLVLLVQDGENYVEGLLRTICYRAFLSKKEMRIVLVDTGSRDTTREIIRRLEENDARIELVESSQEFDPELIRALWAETGTESPFLLIDLRGYKNNRKIIPYLAVIVEL